jgi:hypothetical protein
MNEAIWADLATEANRSASEHPADLEGALRTGALAYRRRMLWAYAVAVLTVVILAGALVWAGSAAHSAPGTATRAATGGASASATGAATATGTATTTGAVLSTIRIAPDPMRLPQNDTQQAVATGVYGDGTTQPLGSTAIWSTGSTKIAEVSPQGIVYAIAPGTTTITATQNGITGTAILTVPLRSPGSPTSSSLPTAQDLHPGPGPDVPPITTPSKTAPPVIK